MSTREEDSNSQDDASLHALAPNSDTSSGVQRSRTEGASDRVSARIQSSSLSFPRATQMTSYGQHSYRGPAVGRNPSGPISPHEFGLLHPPQPSGVAPGASPFVTYAPGFPVQQPGLSPTVIAPLPFNSASGVFGGYPSTGLPPMAPFTTSSVLPPRFNPQNQVQRTHTPGTLSQSIPGAPSNTFPTTTYSFGLDGTQGQSSRQRKTPGNLSEDWFNLFWLFCLLGPLTWPCALFGICSDRRGERIAGFVSLVLLTLALVVAAVLLSQAADKSNDQE